METRFEVKRQQSVSFDNQEKLGKGRSEEKNAY